MNFKKILSFFIALPIIFSSAPCFAYELPHSFWELADRYQAAQENNDKNELIAAGSEIVSLLENEEKNEQVLTILASKLYDMGYAYEELGGTDNYIKAGQCFEKYIPFGSAMNWSDGVKISKQKSMQFKPALELYTPTSEPQSYFGVVNEPEKGVLYGEVSEHFRDNESMILLYLEYGGSTDFTWPEHILSKAREGGKAVELALNFPHEGSQLNSIISDTQYIGSLLTLLKKYSDVPIFLRIGAEVNVWQNKADKNLYIQAFRKIADAARTAGSNIAIVWSVLHTSEWSIDFDDYYPGDEYVDWVGISAYANRYFGAREWAPDESHNPIVYKAGDAADPVLLIRDIVERYGDRKPIMLAECGSAYYTKGEINAYSTDWAVTSLKRMYSMIPIVYPQVKLIAYFNKNMPNEFNYYDLESCTELKAAYNEATQYPWFIQKNFKNKVEYSYKHIENVINTDSGTLELYAYPHVYGDDKPTVNYYINGTWVASVSDLPYHKTLDLSTYPSGSYTLTAEADSSGYSAVKKNYTLNINANPADELAGLSDYQKTALEYCKSIGIISGYEDGTVKPYNSITRAEFASMTSRLCGLSSNLPCSFDDAASHWATNYIRACVDAGAISGIGGNKFSPDSNVTFEQAVKIITCVCGLTSSYDIDALGGYPDAYLTIGRNSALLTELDNLQTGTQLNRINAAVLFYNSQSAQMN